jgi:hypothetical protein
MPSQNQLSTSTSCNSVIGGGSLTVGGANYNSYISQGTGYATTTTYSTYPPLPKEGTIQIDSESLQARIYITEKGGWVNCDIEEVKKLMGVDGKESKCVTVSMSVSVKELKKQNSERTVLFEKMKPIPKTDWTTIGNLTGLLIQQGTAINTLPYNYLQQGTTNPWITQQNPYTLGQLGVYNGNSINCGVWSQAIPAATLTTNNTC